jgi:hypothetical protein
MHCPAPESTKKVSVSLGRPREGGDRHCGLAAKALVELVGRREAGIVGG